MNKRHLYSYYLRCFLIIVLCNLVDTRKVVAQNGHFFMGHFETHQHIGSRQINDIEQGPQGKIFFAANDGIIAFDGKSWQIIKTPAPAKGLQYIAEKDAIYVAGKHMAGHLTTDTTGAVHFESFSLSGKAHLFEKISYAKPDIYFYSDSGILRVDTLENLLFIDASVGKPFGGYFVHRGRLFVNIMGEGVQRVEGKDKQIPYRSGKKFGDKRILFYFQFNAYNTAVGTSDNELYLFDGKTFKQFARNTEVRDFLKENILSNGINIDNEKFALSTLTGGCMIIEKTYGKIEEVINYQTGLPDDEIKAMNIDRNNGLWMLHEYGLSRADLNLPVMNFTFYPGLAGNINSLWKFNGKMYVFTSEGIFYLDEVSAREVLSYSRNIASVQDDKRNMGLKSKIKGMFDGGSHQKDMKMAYTSRNSKAYAIASIKHRYRKVGGLHTKARKMIEVDGRYFVATNNGLFEIIDSIAVPVFSGNYINNIMEAKQNDAFYVSVSDKGLFKFRLSAIDSIIAANGDVFSVGKLLIENNKQISSLLEKDSGQLWAASGNEVFLLEIKNDTVSRRQQFLLESKQVEEIQLANMGNNIVAITNDGVYNYKSVGSFFKKDTVSYKELASDFEVISGQKQFLWMKTTHGWKEYLQNKQVSFFLKLFPYVRYIFVDGAYIWVVTPENEIFRITSSDNFEQYNTLEVYIEGVTDEQGNQYSREHPVLSYENNSITIKLSVPYFIKPEDIMYQYYIEGLMSAPSSWSTDSKIRFPYLPHGEYVLTVRAKNVFGHVSEDKHLTIKIKTPFWKEQWFYITVISLVVVIIVFIIVWINRRHIRRERILQKKVDEQTIQIRAEKDKVEELLLNILPKETADELKMQGKAQPRDYEMVTVLFTDFKDFTKISEKMSTHDLVSEIDFCFRQFDQIVDKHKVEKIKTIGDAYMCAGGLPVKNKTNPIDVVRAGVEMIDFMKGYIENRKKEGKPFFEIRIGIHTGKVIAGIVGIKKYAYDIWGDTVNIASRLETASEEGKINISGATYKHIEKNYHCTYRGKIEVKNKGEIDMYFVNGEKNK